jgi:hypothetical protein
MAAQKSIGQKGGARGGNTTKRIRLVFSLPDSTANGRSVAEWLRTGRGSPAADPIDLAASKLAERGAFDPRDDRDARQRMNRAIAIRQGQPAFRSALMVAYRGMCAFSRCNVHQALEAAHILPWRGEHTNRVKNGLLLRSDMHVLFDRRLATVDMGDPRDWKVLLSPRLRRSAYADLNGVAVHLPAQAGDRPDTEAVRLHREKCGY